MATPMMALVEEKMWKSVLSVAAPLLVVPKAAVPASRPFRATATAQPARRPEVTSSEAAAYSRSRAVELTPTLKPVLLPALMPALKPVRTPALMPALKPVLTPVLKPADPPARRTRRRTGTRTNTWSAHCPPRRGGGGRCPRGAPFRDEIKRMLEVTWADASRAETTAACLRAYRSLLQDSSKMLGLFGQDPDEADKAFMRGALFRFKGDLEAGLTFMRKVSEILQKGAEIGNPGREAVVAALDEHDLDARTAARKLRDEYRRIKDAELKEQYRQNREKQRASVAEAAPSAA